MRKNLQRMLAYLALCAVLAGTLADIINARIDPRLQLGGDA